MTLSKHVYVVIIVLAPPSRFEIPDQGNPASFNDFVFSEGKEFVTAVVSMLIDSVKNQSEHKMKQPTKMDQPAKSDHTSKMDQLYSLWCREPTPVTESEPKTIIALTVENVIITTGQPDVKEVQPKSRLEGDSFEEVQKIIIVCAPIVSISVLLILLVLIFQTCKGAGSSAPIPKIQILPVATGREIFYQEKKTIPCVSCS